MDSVFRKIGQFEISVDGEIVNLWASPEFNLEAALEYAAAMETIIDGMPPKFGVLTRFEAPPIVGPDVEASLKETAAHRARRGMVAVAFVIQTIEHTALAIAHAQWERIYRPIDVPFAIFADVESARPWLLQQIQASQKAGSSRPQR